MAGTFSKSALPKRPGAYFNFQSRKPEPRLVSTTGVVALAASHSWGPDQQVVELNSFGDFLALFSQGGTTPPAYTAGYRAVRDAFKGEGLPGYGGAGQVLFYRLAHSAVAASHSFSNGSTNAITLTAIYKGTYGNKLTASVSANAVDPTNKHDLVVYVDGVEVERYTYAKANITDLAAQINGVTPYGPSTKSDWVVASSVTSGTALTTVSQTALTGGDDGISGIAAQDYTDAMTAFEPYRFSVFTIDALTDSSVVASVKTWAKNLNSKGKRFITVFGGLAAEVMATAVSRSQSLDDPNIVNLGGGTYTDDDYGDVSTAQLTARISGIIAQRGVAAEITFARLAGLSIKVGNTDADLVSALENGVIAIGRDSHPTAPLRLELGVTTYTDTTDSSRPVEIYGTLKFVRVMHDLETELTEWAEQNVIGKLQVNAATRDYVRGQAEARMAARERAGVILPGWSVTTDTTPPPSDTDTFVALAYEVTLGRGLQQVLNTVVVG